MLIINSSADMAVAADASGPQAAAERLAFLQAMHDDMITFDDAVYPEDYDNTLQPGDEGYIAPVIRREWNAGPAKAWGFASRNDLAAALQSPDHVAVFKDTTIRVASAKKILDARIASR